VRLVGGVGGRGDGEREGAVTREGHLQRGDQKAAVGNVMA